MSKEIHTSRVLGLDLLRGLCAVAVVAYHLLSWRFRWPIESAGAFAVYVFFVLSGLTMMMVYGKRFSIGINGATLQEFFRARCARLLPMLAFSSVGTFVTMVVFLQPPTLDEGIKTVLTSTAIFSLGAPALLANVTGGWSLGIEGLFYLLFPTLAVLSANASWRSLAVWFVVMFAAQQITTILIHRTGLPFWYFYVSPLTFAPFFLMGMAISKIASGRSINWLILMLAAVACICGFSIALPSVDIYSTPWAYTLLTVLSGTAVLSAFRATIVPWLAPVASFLGDISYALYLTHWITYVFTGQIATALGLRPTHEAMLFVLFAPLVAYVSHRFVEIPARNLLKATKTRSGATELQSLP